MTLIDPTHLTVQRDRDAYWLFILEYKLMAEPISLQTPYFITLSLTAARKGELIALMGHFNFYNRN